ncbi:DUF1289 domain-containing protein [Methylobrevis pamukkalensis]|uniref:Fe-S protein n=1 Tax=Methylobrevis pamukkalensis TaxID=1439726 RepID=A0A1E3GZ00_9HYPH|nr:DUF1289 domain-containing protein [Methylobrevis pamukkalensis]ODN69273.1 hypothetical protein A6302_03431 [Methylobrevis pamukkalensis]
MAGVSTPCVKICVINEASGLCRGCLRTLGEIAGWGSFSEAERQRLIQIASRRSLPLAGRA